MTRILSTFLLPPLNLLFLSGLGIVLLTHHPRLGRSLIIIAWVLLYGISTPFIGRALLRSLENIPPLQLAPGPNSVEAIVVLAGIVCCDAPEYGGDTVGGPTLERLRYAARLQRMTGKPILVSGGKPLSTTAESILMKDTLVNDFHVAVQWIEDQSTNTRENARFSAALLQTHGFRRIYLVTHAWHMARAAAAFEKAGVEVIPAPTAFTTSCGVAGLDFLPNGHAVQMSALAMREWVGRLWYRFT